MYLPNFKTRKAKSGDIWRTNLSNYDFLITDDKHIDNGVVRGSVVSLITEAGDGNDVIIKTNFFPSKRIVFRLTDIPIHTDDLVFCIGVVTPDQLELVKESLENRYTSGYNELQLATISEIISEITTEVER